MPLPPAGAGREDEIEKTQEEASTRLRRQTPLQLDCWFAGDDVLEVALDLAEQRYNDKLFRLGCHESDEDAPPSAAAAPVPADPTAAPAGAETTPKTQK